MVSEERTLQGVTMMIYQEHLTCDLTVFFRAISLETVVQAFQTMIQSTTFNWNVCHSLVWKAVSRKLQLMGLLEEGMR